MINTLYRTGLGFDAHCFLKGRKLVLGGVKLDYEFGLDGHSDADVLCHAVMDALLGSVAKGDIGLHYPDSDPRWKDARSLDLLKDVALMLRSDGWIISNVDTTVIAEVPKLAPYIGSMRELMAEAIGVGVDSVSVKATTVERMGALGRREGVAAMAVATVFKKKDEK